MVKLWNIKRAPHAKYFDKNVKCAYQTMKDINIPASYAYKGFKIKIVSK